MSRTKGALENRAAGLAASRSQQHGTRKADRNVRNVNKESHGGVRNSCRTDAPVAPICALRRSASPRVGRKSSHKERPGSDFEFLVACSREQPLGAMTPEFGGSPNVLADGCARARSGGR